MSEPSARARFVEAMREMRQAFKEDRRDSGNDWGKQIVEAFADAECSANGYACNRRVATIDGTDHAACRAELLKEVFGD